MAETVSNAVRHSIDKITNLEKLNMVANKEKVLELEERLEKRDRDIYSYQETAKQMESELENLLTINEMY